MNSTDFTCKKSSVAAVYAMDQGTEIWVRNENGSESSYIVNDDSFRAREGHEITAILYGRHPVALRNDTTQTKIQLLSGEDLLGSAPQVESKSAGFWLCWFLFFGCGGMMLVGMVMVFLQHLLGDGPIVSAICSVISVAVLLGIFFGVPYAFIVHPRIKRARHIHQIKSADKVIAQLFKPL